MKSKRLLPYLLIVVTLWAGWVLAGRAVAQPMANGPSSVADGVNVELVGQIGGPTNAVAGSYAYVGVGPSLVVLNVADPSRPLMVGQSRPLPGIVQGVVVAGTYAYVADGEGLRVIDVSDPTRPREVGAYDTPLYT